MLVLYLDTSALIVAGNKSVLKILAGKEVEIRLTHIQVDENMKKYLPFREYGEILESLKKKFEKSGVIVKQIPLTPVVGSRIGLWIIANERIEEIYGKVVQGVFEKDKKRRKLVKYLGVERFKGLIENLPRVNLNQVPEEVVKIICNMIRDAIVFTSSYLDSSKHEENYSYVFITGDKALSEVAEAIVREYRSCMRVKCLEKTEPNSMINLIRQLN